ncbi:4-hydroxy-tetrahydrodipicolinate synthase [Mycobacterium sp. M1]|uniref:4-hydroxy-tetrahydrodipicolinate synthase n=1 Tax=Mycolicibacter acidiphilus TaxID=2835306 RepID=A0ABS5RHK3_9MYCO|nr:4-hydroxy-tetrahydrodipicolinate synthase [Mycolicibacter acidiphilus]MBS9533669.1 4-hydroxy-tetrahydrodipicolinate synthase [Mycolicibacter acidiphilus]
MPLSGLFVPLVTPFTPGGDLAADALERLAHDVLDDGAAGIVALGTTAETAALTVDERSRVIDVCADVCAQRDRPLIVGAGTSSTAESQTMVTSIDRRATAALVVVPYYVRPTEQGVVEHFRQLAGASPVPLLVYNVPYRTGRPLAAGTLAELARMPNIIGFKHAVGGIDDTTIEFMSRALPHTTVLAGDDLFVAPMLVLGAAGAISASANVATRAYADLLTAWRDGAVSVARGLHDRLAPLVAALSAGPNPVVLKAVLHAQRRIPSPRVRLPLLPADPAMTAAALDAC